MAFTVGGPVTFLGAGVGYPLAAWAINGMTGTQIGCVAAGVTGLGAAAMSEVTTSMFKDGTNVALPSVIGNWLLCHFAAQALSEAIGWLPMTFAEMFYVGVLPPVCIIAVIVILIMLGVIE